MSSQIVSLVHLYNKRNVSTELVMFFPLKTVGHVFKHGTLVFGVCVLCNFLIIFCIIIPNCIAEIFAPFKSFHRGHFLAHRIRLHFKLC